MYYTDLEMKKNCTAAECICQLTATQKMKEKSNIR